MDYSKFKYIQKNDYHKKTILYDFDIKTVTWNQANTFPNIRSIIAYLDKYSNIQLYLTQTVVDDYFEDWDKIVLNFNKYMQFCENIWKSDERKVEAFFSRGLRHISDEEKEEFRNEYLESDILKSIKDFSSNEREKLFSDIKQIDWIDLSVFENINNSSLSSKDISTFLKSVEKWEIDSALIWLLLNKVSSDEKIIELIKSLSDEEKNQLTLNHEELKKRRTLNELSERFKWDFSETTGDDSWQKWISENYWVTWVNYIQPIEKQKISITWIMPDYLFPTNDWFIDILEIKLPKHEVLKKDDSHKWSWIWSSEVNKAIWQVINYIWEIDRQCLEIEKEILKVYYKNIRLLKPRAYILIWNDDKWYEEELNAEIRNNMRNEKLDWLRKLNWSLHWIEVITYAELLRRGNTFIKK